MFDVNTVNALRRQCYELELDHKEVLDKYTDEELSVIFNGIGPDRFPAQLRKLLDTLHPSLLPAALIHDMEYHEGGTEADFTAANERFRANGIAVAKSRYSLFNRLRYLTMWDAVKFARLCQCFGRSGWRMCAAIPILALLLPLSACSAASSIYEYDAGGHLLRRVETTESLAQTAAHAAEAKSILILRHGWSAGVKITPADPASGGAAAVRMRLGNTASAYSSIPQTLSADAQGRVADAHARAILNVLQTSISADPSGIRGSSGAAR